MIIVRIGLGITTLGGSSTAITHKSPHGEQSTFQRVQLRFAPGFSGTDSELGDALALGAMGNSDVAASSSTGNQAREREYASSSVSGLTGTGEDARQGGGGDSGTKHLKAIR